MNTGSKATPRRPPEPLQYHNARWARSRRVAMGGMILLGLGLVLIGALLAMPALEAVRDALQHRRIGWSLAPWMGAMIMPLGGVGLLTSAVLVHLGQRRAGWVALGIIAVLATMTTGVLARAAVLACWDRLWVALALLPVVAAVFLGALGGVGVEIWRVLHPPAEQEHG